MTLDAVKKEFAVDLSKVSPVLMIEIMLAGRVRSSRVGHPYGSREKNAKIRFRVDGLLHDIFDEFTLPAYEALVSRIKLLSGDEN